MSPRSSSTLVLGRLRTDSMILCIASMILCFASRWLCSAVSQRHNDVVPLADCCELCNFVSTARVQIRSSSWNRNPNSSSSFPISLSSVSDCAFTLLLYLTLQQNESLTFIRTFVFSVKEVTHFIDWRCQTFATCMHVSMRMINDCLKRGIWMTPVYSARISH